MGLNIVAKRKMSLKGFAQGWDDCFLIVRAANEAQRKEWQAALTAGQSTDEVAQGVVRDAALEVIESGVVINTREDGMTEPIEFGKADVADVVDALNFAWQLEVVGISTGTDRLKATISSV